MKVVAVKIISDLHIHSRFAMACSDAINLQGIEETAVQKGINLISTGDFTHPLWLKELKSTLEPAEPGLFKMKGSSSGVRFILGSEVSTVFGQGERQRRIHHCILAPSFDAVDAINERLSKRGDLMSDGRPQVSMSAAELVDELLKSDNRTFVFPAHAWTPYFGVFGALSGVDSMKEAYEDQEKNIFALETGLSSSPEMNWRLSALDKYSLLSNSDMHSLQKIGREMNVFNLGNLSYDWLIRAIKEKDKKTFEKTVEFFPEEGKYHFDGHRPCMVSIDPDKQKSITRCPVCGGKIVVGVLHRINNLADRDSDYSPSNRVPYVKTVPLREIIAYVNRKAPTSVAVTKTYLEMMSKLGTEYSILVDVSADRISEGFGEDMGKAVENMRKGDITIEPGYAGVFGKIDLLNRDKQKKGLQGWKQKVL